MASTRDCLKGTCHFGALSHVMIAIAVALVVTLVVVWWRERRSR